MRHEALIIKDQDVTPITHKRVKRLIREGLPAVLIAGQYMMSEKTYLEWIDRISQKKGAKY